jgi:hypothetical protein
MKKLVFLFLIFVFLSLPAQAQKDLFGTNPTTVSVTTTTTTDSDPFKIRDNLWGSVNEKPWGLFGFLLTVDTLVAGVDTAANGTWEEDSILYFIVYDPVDGDSVVGDTILWRQIGDKFVTSLDSAKWIKPHAHNGTRWYYKSDPTADHFQGFPLNDISIYLRRKVVGDSSNFRESTNLFVQ